MLIFKRFKYLSNFSVLVTLRESMLKIIVLSWPSLDVLVVAVFISPDGLLLGSLAQIMGVVSHGKCK